MSSPSHGEFAFLAAVMGAQLTGWGSEHISAPQVACALSLEQNRCGQGQPTSIHSLKIRRLLLLPQQRNPGGQATAASRLKIICALLHTVQQ